MKKIKYYWRKAKVAAGKAGALGSHINQRFVNYLRKDKKDAMNYRITKI